MLLTCNSCRNTYVIDDTTIEASGGSVLCEQCQVPLVPLSAGGGADDKTSVLEGYDFGSLETNWRKEQLGAPPSAAANGPGPAAPAGMAGPGSAAGPGAAPAAKPSGRPQLPPTVALSMPEPLAPPGPQNDRFIGQAERTMAFDVDSLGDPAQAPVSPAPATPSPAAMGSPTGPVAAVPPQQARKGRQVIIGGGAGHMHQEKTAAIDASDIDNYVANKPNEPANPYGQAGPGRGKQQQRRRQIPGQRRRQQQRPQVQKKKSGGSFLLIAVIIFGVILIGGAVFVAILLSASEEQKSGEAETESSHTVTYSERLQEARSAPSVFMPAAIEGPTPEDATIVVVGAADGVFVEADLSVPFSGGLPSPDLFEGGTPLIGDLASVLNETGASLPVVVLVDQSVPMKAVYPVIYTAFTTGRKVYFGGSSVSMPNLAGTIEILPWHWPPPPSGKLPPSGAATELRVVIEDKGITLKGQGVNPEGVKKNERVIEKLVGSYDNRSLTSGLAAAKGSVTDLDAVRLAPEEALSFGDFMEIALLVRGDDFDFPRFKAIYMEPPH